jgi:hypothetical protein
MPAAVWAEDVVAGRTPVRTWTFHVLEIRMVIEQIIEMINTFSPGSSLGAAIPGWLPPAPGRPRAAVMKQLQDTILEL